MNGGAENMYVWEMKKQRAVFMPIIQGRIDMTYPRCGQEVTILSIDHYSFTEPEDPMCTIQFDDGTLDWWNLRDLKIIQD